MSAKDYTWVDSDGDELTVESAPPASPSLTVSGEDLGQEYAATVYLPTDPAEVKRLMLAIAEAAGCTVRIKVDFDPQGVRFGPAYSIVVEKQA